MPFVDAPDSGNDIVLPLQYTRGITVVQYLAGSRITYIRPCITVGQGKKSTQKALEGFEAEEWIANFALSQKNSGICCILYVFVNSFFLYSKLIGEKRQTQYSPNLVKPSINNKKQKSQANPIKWRLKDSPCVKRKRKSSFSCNVVDDPNVGCLFVLEDVLWDGGTFKCHLRRFANDAIPLLPQDVVPIDGDSPVGTALLQWMVGQEITSNIKQSGIAFHYRVISCTHYTCTSHTKANDEQLTSVSSMESGEIDHAKHANGHLAREEKGWGSLPMHDSYGDESTGEERDFEDYAEYSANYAE